METNIFGDVDIYWVFEVLNMLDTGMLNLLTCLRYIEYIGCYWNGYNGYTVLFCVFSYPFCLADMLSEMPFFLEYHTWNLLRSAENFKFFFFFENFWFFWKKVKKLRR